MKCSEFRNLVCDCIDNRLSKEAANELNEHSCRCPHCKTEYDSVYIAKSVVQKKIPRASVPTDVYYSILQQTRTTHRFIPLFLIRLFGESALNPVVTFIFVLIVALGGISLLQTPNAHPVSAEKNIINQSLKNYAAVMGGTIKPAMVSQQADDVKKFLAKEVQFDVNVPAMEGCEWCGGVLSSFDGVQLAHVVYKIGGVGIIYIYQAEYNDAMNGEKITLPENVKASLIKTGWYVEQTSDKQSIALWKHENTLCVAVSAIEKNTLLALLTEKKLSK